VLANLEESKRNKDQNTSQDNDEDENDDDPEVKQFNDPSQEPQ
jgi:hypothetical protein